MTEIAVFFHNGRPTGFDAKGHTGYAKSGEDIVCAAVSAITQTAAMGVLELCKCPSEFDIKDGRLRLKIADSSSAQQREKAELILSTMLLGLRSVQRDYSDYLKLIEREV